jgi:dinuclear metal center YbgI/SA1388 family protein
VADRDELIAYADRLLEAPQFDDYGPNGLQVPGVRELSTLASGVSANLELIERAIEADAGMLLVHHGLFWDSQPRSLGERLAGRLRAALGAGLSIAAYHLPLDAHPEIGNNALLCERLGFTTAGRFAAARGREIGIVGRSSEGVSLTDLVARVSAELDREPTVLGDGPDTIHSVGFISGGGASFVDEAAQLGLDALLTGEPAEPATADASESGIHFVAAGHHATETLGVRRLGELLAERFEVDHRFIDVPNPI